MNKGDFDIVSLLSNKDFRDWVLLPNEDRDLFWKKWLEQNPDKRQMIESARELVVKMKFKERQLGKNDLEEMLNEIIIKSDPYTSDPAFENSKGTVIRRILGISLKIAASVILAGCFYYLVIHSKVNIGRKSINEIAHSAKANPKGERSTFLLPDGTKVTLNADSKLLFPDQFPEDKREVELIGEAFFEVVKDSSRPFTVFSNEVSVTALGTSFNVNAFPDQSQIQVALVTGKVVVKKRNFLKKDDEYILNPGEKYVYNKQVDSDTKVKFEESTETGWRQGVVIFENATFEEFIIKLERAYGVHFDVKGPIKKDWSVNGKFENETLEDVLNGLSFTYNITYSIRDKNVTIEFKD